MLYRRTINFEKLQKGDVVNITSHHLNESGEMSTVEPIAIAIITDKIDRTDYTEPGFFAIQKKQGDDRLRETILYRADCYDCDYEFELIDKFDLVEFLKNNEEFNDLFEEFKTKTNDSLCSRALAAIDDDDLPYGIKELLEDFIRRTLFLERR